MLLIIDNYDSFVHNLARYMELAGWDAHVVRNDKITVQQAKEMAPDAVLISPGPRAPRDSGICVDLIKKMGPYTPILGVCLGHQCIGAAYGAEIIRAPKPTHGKASLIRHEGDALFSGLPRVFRGARYHSLAVRPGAESPLKVIAETNEGEIMAMRHRNYPVYGLQFHPESILTEHGLEIIQNFTAIAARRSQREAA